MEQTTKMKRIMASGLVLTTVMSWFLFPILLKFLYPLAFKTMFLLMFMAIFLVHLTFRNANQFTFTKEQKVFFFLWSGYLFSLMISTVSANDLYAYKQMMSVFLKVLFFVFLLFYIDEKYIRSTFSIYSNLMVISVIGAIVVAIGVGMEVLEPVTTLRNEAAVESHYLFDVYWGSYYRLSPLSAPFPLFRLQGFAEEPGTFAFALMPALFWMLYVKKAVFRSILLAIGMLGTYSIGMALALVIILPLLFKVRSVKSFENTFIVVLILLFAFIYVVPTLNWGLFGEHIGGLFREYTGGLFAGYMEDKAPTVTLRLEALSVVLNYLREHPMGTGAGLGMITVNYAIAVGFANAVLESGILGGGFYLLMFSLLTWFAVRMVWQSSSLTLVNSERIAIGLSVIACMMMGLQRQQPDLSSWHMWIYASFFYMFLQDRKIQNK